ncbi:MAG: AMP-binding protein [Thermomicrobiales bacterium]
MTQPVSFGRRLSMLAEEHPDRDAIIFIPVEGEEERVSWERLDRRSNQVARLLAGRGVDENSRVVVGMPNIPAHFILTYAAWKLGALVIPIRSNLPARERDALLDLAAPTIVIAPWGGEISHPFLSREELEGSYDDDDSPLPDVVPNPGSRFCSGGSTGRPKIIVDPRPWAFVPGEVMRVGVGMRQGQVQLVAGPLYHNSPFSWSHMGLFEDHTLVLLEKFDAAKVVDTIERHRVNFGFLAPTMMRRIILLPDVEERDFSSVEAFFHTAAPCPPWLKRAWIDLIGPEKLYEGFGSTEAVGACRIRGDEWLEHPGLVGRPFGCELRILDDDFNEVPTGEVGEIFMRPEGDQPTYEYIGSDRAKTTPDGFVSAGDMGWVDDEGYLFLADRRTDLIITGGANVYPAEVEAALSEHPGIADVAVIGLPDDEWGKRVHGVIQPGGDLTVEELDAHCRERLSSYKVPKTWEFVEALPRDEAGKLRRSALVAERLPAV